MAHGTHYVGGVQDDWVKDMVRQMKSTTYCGDGLKTRYGFPSQFELKKSAYVATCRSTVQKVEASPHPESATYDPPL